VKGGDYIYVHLPGGGMLATKAENVTRCYVHYWDEEQRKFVRVTRDKAVTQKQWAEENEAIYSGPN
jgi:hypothetical protein